MSPSKPRQRGRPRELTGERTVLRIAVGQPERDALAAVRESTGETRSDIVRRLIHEEARRVEG